ncbi:MAG: hypothetical protein COC04_00855, partial [Gammaproteobacteria bacterium]
WLKKSFKGASQGISAIDGPLGGVSSRLTAVNGLVTSGSLAWVGFGAAIAGSVFAVYKSISAFSEYEQQQLKIQALLKATGGGVGFTADQLDEQARAVAFATLASTKGIQEAQGVLLTFKAVQGDTFRSAIKLSQDMAAVMGGTAKSAALQLGKALEDPATGLNALKRAGVSFTDAEKEQIKVMQKSGRLLEAQTVILAKLRGQIDGAGSAEAGGVAGAVDTLGQSWDELLIGFSKSNDLGGGAKSFLDGLSTRLKNLTEIINPSDASRFNKLAVERVEIENRLAEIRKTKLGMMGFFKGHHIEIIELEEREAQVLAKMAVLRDENIAKIKEQRDAQTKASEVAKEAAEQLRADTQAKQEEIEAEKEEKLRLRLEREAATKSEQVARDLENLELSLMTEEERLEESYRRRNEIIKNALGNRDATELRRKTLLQKSKDKRKDDSNKLEAKRKKKEYKVDENHWAAKLRGTSSFFNRSAALSLGGSKAIFNIQKTAALAGAMVALPASVMESYHNGGGYPWGIIPAGLMLAEGLSNINQIKNSSFGGGGGGGGAVSSGGGASLASPEIDAEAIIPEQAEKLDQVIRVEIDGWDEDGLLPARTTRMIVESIAEQIGQNVSIG